MAKTRACLGGVRGACGFSKRRYALLAVLAAAKTVVAFAGVQNLVGAVYRAVAGERAGGVVRVFSAALASTVCEGVGQKDVAVEVADTSVAAALQVALAAKQVVNRANPLCVKT